MLSLHTLAAVSTTVADEATGAVVALGAVMGRIEAFCGNGATVEVGEAEVNGGAFDVHARFVGHFALEALVWQVVGASVLDKDAASFDEAKAGVVAHAVLT